MKQREIEALKSDIIALLALKKARLEILAKLAEKLAQLDVKISILENRILPDARVKKAECEKVVADLRG